MTKTILMGVVLIALPAALLAQGQAPAPSAGAPAAAASAGRVAVVDFQKVVLENADGKKAQEKLMAEVTKRQKDFEEKQKSLQDAQNKLQTQDKVLTDTAKADLTRQIDKLNTDLQRMNDDAQKEIGDLQQQLLRPIADRARKVCQAYPTKSGFAGGSTVPNQATNIFTFQCVADSTPQT